MHPVMFLENVVPPLNGRKLESLIVFASKGSVRSALADLAAEIDRVFPPPKFRRVALPTRVTGARSPICSTLFDLEVISADDPFSFNF